MKIMMSLKILQRMQAKDLIEVKVQPHAHGFVCGRRLQHEGSALALEHDRQGDCSIARSDAQLQPGRRRADGGPTLSAALVCERTTFRTIALATTRFQAC
jgi:hypothetical protein